MQKALKIKNVARYLAIHAKQMQLAQCLYIQMQNANCTTFYANYAAKSIVAINAKHANKIVANANALSALIIAQCLNNSNTFYNAQADLQYILNVHALTNS